MLTIRSLIVSALVLSPALATPSPLLDDPTALVAQTSAQNATFDQDSGFLSEAFPSHSFALDGDWLEASVGVMLERDIVAESGKMLRRGSKTGGGGVTRDLFSEEVSLPLSERGEVDWPTSWTGLSKLVKRGALSFTAVITWYTGHDLLNPYCAQASKWTPTDQSMVAAVTEKWGKNRPSCGAYLQVSTPNSKKSIVVRVVDLCGGCAPGKPHVDLSIAAFKALYGLDVGLVSNMQIKLLSGPPVSAKKWTSKLKLLYGPTSL